VQQLTEVDPSNFSGAQVVLVAAGSYMAAAVTVDQKIWVWGSPRNVPGVEAPIVSPMALDLSLVSEGTIWRKIWVGSDTLFVQSDAGTIFVWGSNNGLETCMESLSPLQEKRSVNLPPFDINYPPVTIEPINEDETGLPPDLAAPQESPFAPETPLKLTPWNPPGGLATTQVRLMAVSTSPIGKASPTYDVDGSPISSLDAATSTMESAIFITTNRKIFTCGGNYWGQRGAIMTAVEPTEVFGVDAATVVDVAAGSSHFTILTSANEIFSFGRNDAGQLGRGFVNWTRIDEIGVWELDSVSRSVGELSQAERQVTTITSGSFWSLAAYTSPIAPAPVFLQPPLDNKPAAPRESPLEPPNEPVDNSSKHMVLAIIFIAAIGISVGAAICFRAQKCKAAATTRADMIPLEDLSSRSARPNAPTPLESYVI
jgi:alpha-tubulin suppressor-like RCC1 family protein